jgi:co-chaperonin GroES (HSP10)
LRGRSWPSARAVWTTTASGLRLRFTGTEFKLEDAEHVIVREDEILGIVS